VSGVHEVPAAGAAFTLDEILAATGGELAALGPATHTTGVTTDSRRVEPGELFVAIRGDRHDGHRFVPEAAARGAGAVLVERNALEALPPCGVVAVRDTLAALGDLAAFHRRRLEPRVLAVTGSNGKTTTKEMLAAIVEGALGRDRVVHTVGSQNNLVGLPLTLLRVLAGHQMVVLELGMNGPGEIWRLAEIAEPDVGVITCMAPEHLEGLGSMHGVIEANTELYRRLKPSATAVFNADDPGVTTAVEVFPGRKLSFGTVAGPAVAAADIVDHGLEGTAFRLIVAGRSLPIRLAIPGRHNVHNALAAAATAHAAGISLEALKDGLERFQPPGMRMEVMHLGSGVTVLNDAYNANPASMAAALRTLAASRGRRRLAALGEMRELGSEAVAAHRELGAVAAAAGLDTLFLLGPHAGEVRAGAEAAGMPAERIVVAGDHAELATRVRADLRPGDLLLVKGSRGAAMEELLRRLGAEAEA
jgi:UDP-N-acetylmuramoyl-tripeptide--D-alanyl-D-alanine ligase